MISYKHADSKEFAIELEMYLKQHNKKVFRDENEIRAGQHITKKCEQAIRVSQVFLPIFSKHYCEGASDDEFCFNKDKVKRPVVPVVIEGGIIPRNYKMGDTSQVRIQADFKENKEKYFKRILDGVDAHLSGMQCNSKLSCRCTRGTWSVCAHVCVCVCLSVCLDVCYYSSSSIAYFCTQTQATYSLSAPLFSVFHS